MTESSVETFKGTAEVAVTLDLADLLAASGPVGEDLHGEPVYNPPLVDRIVAAAAKLVAKDILRDEFRQQLRIQVEQQVHDGIAAALDASVRTTNTWGEPIGNAKTLRQALVEQAAAEVQTWMTGDRYGGGKFRDFLRKEVDQAVRADLSETLKQARETTMKHMRAAASQAIADAAKSAVTALGR